MSVLAARLLPCNDRAPPLSRRIVNRNATARAKQGQGRRIWRNTIKKTRSVDRVLSWAPLVAERRITASGSGRQQITHTAEQTAQHIAERGSQIAQGIDQASAGPGL